MSYKRRKRKEYRITLQKGKVGLEMTHSLDIKLPNMGMERSNRLWTSISPKEPVPTVPDPAVVPLEKIPPADSTAAGRIDDKEKLDKGKKDEEGEVAAGEVGDEGCSWLLA
jgi:hypothetical protein